MIGTPKTQWELENLTALLKSKGVKRISLLVGEDENAMVAATTLRLEREFAKGNRICLTEIYGFEATLFGWVHLKAEGYGAQYVTLELNGYRIVKEFAPAPMPAHLLINGKNQLVFAKGARMRVRDRYYGSSVITLRAPMIDREKGGGAPV